MYCFIYVLWFVFPVVIIQTRRHWIIFETFKSKILSSLSSKASEPLIISTYSFFLSIFYYLCNARNIEFYNVYPSALFHVGFVWVE
jgi:hypothetical protein